MPLDPAKMKAGMAAVERPPTGIETVKKEPTQEKQETLMEVLEKDVEARFGEMKKRLQQVEATLAGSDEMIKTMKADIEDAKALGEDWQEEGEQLVEYMYDIHQAKTEQARLRDELKKLLSFASQAETAGLNARFSETQSAEDAAAQATRAEVSVDALNEQRDTAEKAGDEKLVAHLESEMVDKLNAMEQVKVPTAEAKDAAPEQPLAEYGQPGAPKYDPVEEAELELGAIESSATLHQKELAERRRRLEKEQANANRPNVVSKLQEELAQYERFTDQGPGAAERVAQYEDLIATYRKRGETDERLSGIQKVIDYYRGVDAAYKGRNVQPVSDPKGVEQSSEQPPQISTRERANRFVRLGTQIKWEMDAAGALTPKIEAMRAERLQLAREQLAALLKERDAKLAADPSANVEGNTETIEGWEQSVASLQAPDKGVSEAPKDRSLETKTRERAEYYLSLQRSEGFALEASHGVVTPEVSKIRAEMLQIATAQLENLRRQPGQSGDEKRQELIEVWEQAVADLKGASSSRSEATKTESAEPDAAKKLETPPAPAQVAAEKVVLEAHADQPRGEQQDSQPETEGGEASYEGIRSPDGMNEILAETAELIEDSERGAMRDRFVELNSLLSGLYGDRFEEMGSKMDWLFVRADEITEEVQNTRQKFAREELTQEEYDETVRLVGEKLRRLERDVAQFTEEFEDEASRVTNHLDQGRERTTAEEAHRQTLNQTVSLQGWADALRTRKRKWRELEDYQE